MCVFDYDELVSLSTIRLSTATLAALLNIRLSTATLVTLLRRCVYLTMVN